MEVVDRTRKAHDEVRGARIRNASVHIPRETQTWRRPNRRWIKINCDASWCRETKTGGIGVIARNADGCVVGGENLKASEWNIEALEAEDILVSVKFAREKDWG